MARMIMTTWATYRWRWAFTRDTAASSSAIIHALQQTGIRIRLHSPLAIKLQMIMLTIRTKLRLNGR